jgi:hypothetical protein
MLEHIPALVFTVDSKHNISYMNSLFRTSFNVEGNECCYEVLWKGKQPCVNCPAAKVIDDFRSAIGTWGSGSDERHLVFQHPIETRSGEMHSLHIVLPEKMAKRKDEH